MKRSWGIFLLYCLLQTLFLAIAFIHSEEVFSFSKKGSSKEIALITYSYSDSYFYREFASAVLDYCDGSEYFVLILDGEAKSETQISEVESLIAKQVSAIIIDPVEPTALDDVLARAMDAGIKTVVLGRKTQHHDVFYSYDDFSSGYKLGASAACWINNELNGSAKIALFISSDLVNLKEREAGIRYALESISPGADISYEIFAIDQNTAYTAAEILFSSSTDVNAILCVNDDGALGALEAANCFSLSDNRFFLGSVDGTTAVLSKVREDPLYKATITLTPKTLAISSIKAAINLLEGESPPNFSHHSYYISKYNLDWYLSLQQ